MARVTLTDDAIEDLKDLDGSSRVMVLKALRALKKLEVEPEKRGAPLGSRATGNLTGYRKLAIAERTLRVVFRVEESGDVVVLWVVAKRSDSYVYQWAASRLETHQNPEVRAISQVLRDLMT